MTDAANKNDWIGETLSGGRYRVMRLLGEGGMASVYLAEGSQPQRLVAIKAPKRHLLTDADAVARFQREVVKHGQLEHRNIAKLFDVGQHDGVPFAVFQYFKGGSLGSRKQRHLPSRPSSADEIHTRLAWLPEIAEALDWIHQQRHIHRDVKPDNILFDADWPGGHAYLGDFGIVRALDRDGGTRLLTETGMVVGTPQFMAPELCQGKPFDGRVDQYALAVSVYYLLADVYPIDGPTTIAVLTNQTNKTPEPLKALVPAVPENLSECMQQALSKEPGERFSDCASFAEEVLGSLVQQPADVAGPRQPTEPRPLPPPFIRRGEQGGSLPSPPGSPPVVSLSPPSPAEPMPASETPPLASATVETSRIPGRLRQLATTPAARPALVSIAAVALIVLGIFFTRPSGPEPEHLASGGSIAEAAGTTGIAPPDASAASTSPSTVEPPEQEPQVATVVPTPTAEKPEPEPEPAPRTDPESDPQVAVALTPTTPPAAEKPVPDVTEPPAVPDQLVQSLEPVPQTGHTSVVRSVSFSPDGRRIASGSSDNTIRLWDAETGEELRKFEGHTECHNSVSFSPDGLRIVSGNSDNTIQLWEIETGKELGRFAGHTESVRGLSFSPDGRRIVSASGDQTLRLWDATTGTELRKVEGEQSFNGVAFSPDGQFIVSGSCNDTIRIWSGDMANELRQSDDYQGCVHNVAYSADGHSIAFGSKDGIIRLWDPGRGRLIRKFERHTSWVTSVSFSPDGRRIVSASGDKTVRLWDAETGEELRKFAGHTNWVYSVSFSPDGRRIVSGSLDNTVRLWDAETGQELAQLLGFTDGSWLVFTPDGRFDGSAAGREKLRFREQGTNNLHPAAAVPQLRRPGLLGELLRGNSPPR